MGNVQLAVQFFFQIAVILVACRFVGFLAGKIGQPQVVAEMIAGVLLGPSFFGVFWPELQLSVFPWDRTQEFRDTQSYLFPASQLGLSLYMFIVGMEFRIEVVGEQLKCSLAVSAAGMIAPFILGAGLGWVFFNYTDLFPIQTSLLDASIFLGASMCITAFPMLARIIHLKGLAGTPMGTVAIGAAAIDDATAWCLLAVVMSSFEGNISSALNAVSGGIAFAVTMMLVVRPLMKHSQKRFQTPDGTLSDLGTAIALISMALGAWFTDLIGLHAVFGAFVAGTAMPRAVTRELIGRIEPLTIALLLPLFFTYSGLNTRIQLLNSWFLWAMCGLVLATAVTGKFGACWLAARASGMPNREALGVGSLMNARGLMELIIINIGLQRGIISEHLFALLVIMAILTTLFASPLFARLTRPSSERSRHIS